ncbi:aminotransferase [Rhodococcus sp. NPDC060176]|uniref:aminotransferase n=1 Tax=Rhodococcus sp. NPDC060176 TaxID=3347062 RepID=UPI003663C74C
MTSARNRQGFDFFAAPPIIPTRITAAEATEFAEAYLGHPVTVLPLGSNQDQNFLLLDTEGTGVGVLRIANPAFTEVESDAQDMAAQAIAEAEPELRLATLLPAVDGKGARPIMDSDGRVGIAKVLRFLPGSIDAPESYLSPATAARMGEISGRVSRALASVEHSGVYRTLQFDMRHADRVTETLLEYVQEGRRAVVAEAAAQAWARVDAVSDQLPMQSVHSDLTELNMMRSPHAPHELDGVLDFGDLCHTWAANELAATVTAMLQHPNVQAHDALPAIAAFHRVRPLSTTEADALWSLVVLRAATLVASGSAQVAVDPANSYAVETLVGEWRMFDTATAVPIDVMLALIRSALGMPVDLIEFPADARALIADCTSATELDVSTTSAVWDEGAWLLRDTLDVAASKQLWSGADSVFTRYAAISPAAPPLTQDEPATVCTGMALWFAADRVLLAPWAGTVRRDGNDLIFSATDTEIVVSGRIESRETDAVVESLEPGDVFGILTAGHRYQLTVRKAGAFTVPAQVVPSQARGWLSLTADPRSLLGLPPAPAASNSEQLLQRRRSTVAEEQQYYYDDPPQIERGWRHHLLSTDGRSYLDMVNNVAVVGHSHPRIADAVNRQLRTLNTNSRFNYEAIVQFCERITDRLPDSLNRVFLVNSGSEAADLALRLAMAVTDRRDVVAMREGYHGWTYAADAISTSVADNPTALTTRPEWVHLVDSANAYRGTHRGSDAHRYAEDAVQRLQEMASVGRPPAAFIAEAVYGNAGGMALPDSYLRQVYAAVRELGGLAIADEVQVGYGRLGSSFWGFEQQGVVPDIVTMAKAMGNGHPLGVVVTSKDLAEKFGVQGSFFSSSGGSPVSSIVGTTVLDIIEGEGLQANAALVGARLLAGLRSLTDKHSLIGEIHGSGLFIGVELVRDRSTMEAASEEAMAICQRMLDYGVLVQPTGDRMCILKVKPPLCLDETGADFFVDTLDRVLTEGY